MAAGTSSAPSSAHRPPATFQAVLVSVTTGESHAPAGRCAACPPDRRRAGAGAAMHLRRQVRSRSPGAARPTRGRLEGVGPRVRNRSWAVAADTLVLASVRSWTRSCGWIATVSRRKPFSPPADYWAPRLSPDGRRVVVIKKVDSSESGDVWQHDFASGANVRITRKTGAVWRRGLRMARTSWSA